MACPVCNRVLCDHSPAERGQTHAEMMADMYADAPSPRGTKSVPAAQKPPAHEVIVARIEEAQRALQGLAKLSCRRKGARTSRAGRAVGATIREHRAIALALLHVLNRMHLPEAARPEILRRLSALDAKVIGGPQLPYARLLMGLSGHDPLTEVATAQHEGGTM